MGRQEPAVKRKPAGEVHSFSQSRTPGPAHDGGAGASCFCTEMAVVLRMTLPCPTGQGTLWGRGAALLAPLGQGRFGRSRAGSWGFGVFAVDGSFRVHGNLLPAREKRWARWSCLSTSEQNHVSGGERRALPAPAQGTKVDCQARATVSKKTSKGESQPRRLRGLWLIKSRTRSNSA